MNTVRMLDSDTINKIAAGEVVERPASVVKELAENAIDAGATRIEIETMAGGTSFMRVTDNGSGMGREDAALAVQRHATSKIHDPEDITAITTLGFRGEALPTIASVSRFSLVTRTADRETGTRVAIDGEADPVIEETGCAVGTTVKVEDLFFNTPARKKFLKTVTTEGNRISECVTKLAISHPGIVFRYISNNRQQFATPGNGDLKDTILCLYGRALADALLPADFRDDDGPAVSGYISKPSVLRNYRSWQTFIVNGRVIESKALNRAVDNAYRNLTPRGGYPLVVLNLAVEPREVDVNVHPRKTEVKFEDESRVYQKVYHAIAEAIRPPGQTLESVAAAPSVQRSAVLTALPQMAVPPASPRAAAPPPTADQREPYVKATQYVHAAQVESMNAFREAQQAVQAERERRKVSGAAPMVYPLQPVAPPPPDASAPTAPATDASVAAMTPIGQVDLCYIVAQDLGNLYIVDQHAAHERILYDRFRRMAEGIPSQQLLVNELIDFNAREMELLEEHHELLRNLGFDFAAAGAAQVRLTEIPADMPDDEAEVALREIVAALVENHALTAGELRHKCLAMTACRSAIKRGEELNQRQMEIILEELAHTERPYTCPHGRPTILRFSGADLAKMFKRT